MYRSGLIGLLALPFILAAPAKVFADAHPPEIHEDQDKNHYKYEYDDGICKYKYEYNIEDKQEHLDRHGDCSRVAVHRYPGSEPMAAPGAPPLPPANSSVTVITRPSAPQPTELPPPPPMPR